VSSLLEELIVLFEELLFKLLEISERDELEESDDELSTVELLNERLALLSEWVLEGCVDELRDEDRVVAEELFGAAVVLEPLDSVAELIWEEDICCSDEKGSLTIAELIEFAEGWMIDSEEFVPEISVPFDSVIVIPAFSRAQEANKEMKVIRMVRYRNFI
jgi:hypothetical protein